MECFVHADKKYFPEYNWFEKAISYPYKAPKPRLHSRMENFIKGYTYHLKIEFQFYLLDLIDLHIN